MARAVGTAHGKKRKISITPDAEILAWISERSGPGKKFATITHAAEVAWQSLRDAEEGKKKRP